MNNNKLLLSRDEARAVDEVAITKFRIPEEVLMENAGRGCVDVLNLLGIDGHVVIFCGKGNNGGDGLVMARHLLVRDLQVTTLLLADPDRLTGPAASNLDILLRLNASVKIQPSIELIQQTLQAKPAWIVDALLGTGFHGDPRPPLKDAIELINQSPSRTLAVDLPSGLDCETGRVGEPTVQADHTCTLFAIKKGMLNDAAREYCGEIHVADIGCPAQEVYNELR